MFTQLSEIRSTPRYATWHCSKFIRFPRSLRDSLHKYYFTYNMYYIQPTVTAAVTMYATRCNYFSAG